MNALRRFEFGTEELILVLLILVEVLDFFTLLPATLEFAEKFLSIIAMCYLFYKASLTKVMVGRQEKGYDIMIIVGFLLLSVKTMIGFVMSAVGDPSLVSGFYAIVLKHAVIIEKVGFYFGILLLIMAAYLLLMEKVSRPSILWMIHEKSPEKFTEKIVHFITLYLVIVAIFITVFTFALEWLAMTIDAAILMILLFFYLFIIVKQGKGMKTESFIRKVSDSSEEFYSGFVRLFQSRKTIKLAITGLLVLHLLVDIGNFIIPYTTGLYYSWYLEGLGPGHLPLSTLIAGDFSLASTILTQIGVMFVYLLNVLAALMLLFGPAYAWAYFYRGKRVRIPNIAWLFFGSLSIFLTEPVFRLVRVSAGGFVGVDILTQALPFISNILLAIVIAVLVATIFYILSKKSLRRTTVVVFTVIFIYLGIYVYYFFTSISSNYISSIYYLVNSGQYFAALNFLVFFAITLLFYVAGYLMILHEAYLKKHI